MGTLPEGPRDVVARAREVITAALDELGPRLVRASGGIDVEAKADGTPVTAADLEADRALAAAIAAAFPAHGIVSEERDTVVPDAAWCWVIDPIDGTSNFTAGLPWWCVAIALAHEGEPVYAVIDAPALGRRYEAVSGEGATRDGRRIRVRAPLDYDDGRQGHVPVMLTTGTARRARAAGLELNPRVMGSTALDLAIVAEGVAAASVAVIPHVWDVAAGTLLVHEAGGIVVTLDGRPLLPLRAGDDHAQLHAATAAGPEESRLRELASRLLPRG